MSPGYVTILGSAVTVGVWVATVVMCLGGRACGGGGGEGDRISDGRSISLRLALPPPVNVLGREYSREMSDSHVSGDHRRVHAWVISGEPGVTYNGG